MGNAPEFRRLIAGFLTLATLAGSLVFLLGQAAKKTDLAPVEVAGSPKKPVNAFVEEIGDSASPLATVTLTEELAQLVGQELESANPDGPAGILGAKSPDLATITEKLSLAAVSRGDLEELADAARPVELKAKDLAVSGSGAAAITRYDENLAQILSTLQSGSVTNILAAGATADGMNALQGVFDEAIVKLERMSVPKELVDFHISLIRLFDQTGKLLATDAGTGDPLQTASLFELRYRTMFQLQNQFAQELAEAQKLPRSEKPTANFFAPKEAHAIFCFIFCFTFDIPNLTEKVIQFAKKAIVETIKDRLIHQMVQQTITWIQGGGKPQFVTNWKGFLKDAGNQAVGQVLDKVAPQLCQSFGPLIRVSLTPQSGLAPESSARCTLDRVVRNVQDFYDDFTRGGWIAYGASLEPKNNFFGAYFETSDVLKKEQSNAERIAKNKALADKGFQGQQDCLRFEWVEVPGTNGTLPSRQQKCAQYRTTTPGATSESVTGQSLLGPLHRIVNAEDVTALVSALVNSALNKLVQIGTKGLLGLRPTPRSDQFPDPCARLKGKDREKCKQTACDNLDEEFKQECKDALNRGDVNLDGCETGEIAAGGSSASAVDPAATEGYWCDMDPMTLEETTAVRLVCDGTRDGYAFITRERIDCNIREDKGTTGWEFVVTSTVSSTESGDIMPSYEGRPIEFLHLVNCADAPLIIESLPAGNYQAGAWTNRPSNVSYVCAVGRSTDSHKECQNKACVLVPGKGEWDEEREEYIDRCSQDSECQDDGGGPRHSVCQGQSCVSVPGEGDNACSRNADCGGPPPPPEPGPILDAVGGWGGDLANNTSDNTWLIVAGVTNIAGRIANNDGTAQGVEFRISDDPGEVGSPRVAYDPNENRYLVAWIKTLTRNSNELRGRFISAAGTPVGPSFAISRQVSGVVGFPTLKFDESNRKFVLGWIEGYGSSAASAAMKTLNPDGSPAADARIVSQTPGYVSAPQTAVGDDGYCTVYSEATSQRTNRVMMRRLDPQTLAPQSASIVTEEAFGNARIVWNSVDRKYFVVWDDVDRAVPIGRFFDTCTTSPSVPFSLATDFGDSHLAYNPVSNSYGLIGVAMDDVRNRFLALKANGEELVTYDLFFDARNGNFVPAIAPAKDGTFGGVSSRDYATYRFAPGLGGDLLKVR